MCIKGGQVFGFCIEMDVPEAIIGVQLAKAGCTIEAMRHIIEGWGLAVFSNNSLIQVLGVKVDMEASIGLAGVKEYTH